MTPEWESGILPYLRHDPTCPRHTRDEPCLCGRDAAVSAFVEGRKAERAPRADDLDVERLTAAMERLPWLFGDSEPRNIPTLARGNAHAIAREYAALAADAPKRDDRE